MQSLNRAVTSCTADPTVVVYIELPTTAVYRTDHVFMTVSHGHIDRSRRASPFLPSVGESSHNVCNHTSHSARVSVLPYWCVSLDRPTDVTGEILNLWYWFYVKKFPSRFVAPLSGARGV